MSRSPRPRALAAKKPGRPPTGSGRARPAARLRDYLEQIVDQANVLVIATDLAGRVVVWNRAMVRLTGFPRETVEGRELLPWLSEAGMPELAQAMRQVAAGQDLSNCEARLPSVSGTVARASFNVATVRAEGGRASAVLAVGQDVTALRVLQNQVIHAEKLATVGQIAAGVAHEINNPLTSIQACVEAVLHKASMATQGLVPNQIDPVDLERLKRVQDGVERIRRFTHDLVGYARPSRVVILRAHFRGSQGHAGPRSGAQPAAGSRCARSVDAGRDQPGDQRGAGLGTEGRRHPGSNLPRGRGRGRVGRDRHRRRHSRRAPCQYF